MTPKIKHNAHKLAFLTRQYPDHSIKQLVDVLAMSPIDTNNSFWGAEELGLIKIDKTANEGAGGIAPGKTPKTWEFGPEVEELMASIMYAFGKLAKESETDLEENYLGNWLHGAAPHDILVAMKKLLADKKLVEYAIEDGENSYVFYTLKENEGKLWGNKQFKQPPLDPMIETQTTED